MKCVFLRKNKGMNILFEKYCKSYDICEGFISAFVCDDSQVLKSREVCLYPGLADIFTTGIAL